MLQNIEEDINFGEYSEKEIQLIRQLLDNGQSHLFDYWDLPQKNHEIKKKFIKTLVSINEKYPGGILSYIQNAKGLLKDSKDSVNPFEGYIPHPPETIDLSRLDETLFDYEKKGTLLIDKLVITLVAGGLGERLGYDGIKINIPFETLSYLTYIEYYSRFITALEKLYKEKTKCKTKIPLIIMVSGDTDEQTRETLKKNHYFGLEESQIHILKQELVPALSDNNASLALKGEYELALKPHGHGDIHMLIYQSGLYLKLLNEGKLFMALIQDTNAQVVNGILSAVAVSKNKNLDFNSIVVPRVPKEAVGAIASLKSNNPKKKNITVNVEYNQLDPLLKETINPEGDTHDASGRSPFPGNINAIIIQLKTYAEVLENSSGLVPEFVNPKYADEKREVFKKPTRLETMMQDLPKLFEENRNVGVTMFDRKLVFSPDKNNIIDAAGKAKKGQPPESAASAESDFFMINRKKINHKGNFAKEAQNPVLYHGVPYLPGARIMIYPEFACTQEEISMKIKNCTFDENSSLVLKGKNIFLDSVHFKNNASLFVEIIDDAILYIRNIAIENELGIKMAELTKEEMNDPNIPEYLKIRGYKTTGDFQRIIIKEKGTYVYQADGSIQREKH